VICQNQQVALGTIFEVDGLIATKASELRGSAVCELADGRRYAAELLGVDRASDLAVLRIPVGDLPAIRWREDDPPAVGSWVVTTGQSDVPQSVGIVSVAPHPVRGGILGVQLAEDQPGPRITYVVPGSAAAIAGLRTGDLVTQVNDVPVQTADALVATTSTLLPGDRVQVTIVRHNQTQQLTAVLGSVEETLSSQRARLQDRLGGALSTRRVLFPLALEHDTVLQPEECGGPLLDLNGQAVGINIARASRIASYAIPARVARPVLEALKAQALHPIAHEAAAR
jgi:serine protease Do